MLKFKSLEEKVLEVVKREKFINLSGIAKILGISPYAAKEIVRILEEHSLVGVKGMPGKGAAKFAYMIDMNRDENIGDNKNGKDISW